MEKSVSSRLKAAKSKFNTVVENISLDFAFLLFCEFLPKSLKTKRNLWASTFKHGNLPVSIQHHSSFKPACEDRQPKWVQYGKLHKLYLDSTLSGCYKCGKANSTTYNLDALGSKLFYKLVRHCGSLENLNTHTSFKIILPSICLRNTWRPAFSVLCFSFTRRKNYCWYWLPGLLKT